MSELPGGAVRLESLSKRVTKAWAYVADLAAAVDKGAHALEEQSVRMTMAAACVRSELEELERRVAAAEERCHQRKRTIAFHFRCAERLERRHGSLLATIAERDREIASLRLRAAELRVQRTLANNVLVRAMDDVSGGRVTLWALQHEIRHSTQLIDQLHHRQWDLEDALDAKRWEHNTSEDRHVPQR